MKIITVIGARPQFIKAAILSRVLLRHEAVREIIIHTGQHFDANMSEVFFTEMDIPKPDYNLGIADLGHGAMTGRMLEKIEQILLEEQPDVVLVYGDTNSTLAGALAAVKLHIPVAHVESGLRSFNRRMPEEHNRVLTDHCADMLFCPTRTAVDNLHKEGIKKGVCLVGDIMYDAALFYASRAKAPKLPADSFPITGPFALATLHRAENTDNFETLKEIFDALSEISNELPILIPLHPRTRKKLVEAGLDVAGSFFAPDGFCLIEPVGYLEMIYLLQHCQIVLTDSGGLQKEAFFFRKPCVTLRDETEWVELVENGANLLAGHNPALIKAAVSTMRQRSMENFPELYGNGKAGEKIAEYIFKFGDIMMIVS